MSSAESRKSHAVAWTLSILAAPLLYVLTAPPLYLLVVGKGYNPPPLWMEWYLWPLECLEGTPLSPLMNDYSQWWLSM